MLGLMEPSLWSVVGVLSQVADTCHTAKCYGDPDLLKSRPKILLWGCPHPVAGDRIPELVVLWRSSSVSPGLWAWALVPSRLLQPIPSDLEEQWDASLHEISLPNSSPSP